MEDRIRTIIRDWLNTEFNNPDALPELMILGIASEINKHRWEIYQSVKREYDLEDIEAICMSQKVELTDDEKNLALHRYGNCEYQDMETLGYIIEEIVEEREKNSLSSSSGAHTGDNK